MGELQLANITDNGEWMTTTMQAGDGVSNTDLLVYLTASAFDNLCLNSDALAYADTCQRDQRDRPVVAYINFCANKVKPDASAQPEGPDILLAVHELYWSTLFPKFPNPQSSVEHHTSTLKKGSSILTSITIRYHKRGAWRFGSCCSIIGGNAVRTGVQNSHPRHVKELFCILAYAPCSALEAMDLLRGRMRATQQMFFGIGWGMGKDS